MKLSKIKILVAFLAPLLLSGACTQKEEPDATGRIMLSVSSVTGVADVTKSSVSDYTSLPSGDDFNIVIIDSKDKTVYEGKVKDYPEDTQLLVGDYTVSASYGNVTDEGFDKPCFIGNQAFTVTSGATNEVNIKVSLANSIIKVACTDAFRNYYTSYSITVKTGNGTSISFPESENRAAFVDAYTISVEGELVSQSGKSSTFSKDYTTPLAPATCYTLKFDAGNIGSGTINITFDNTTEQVDLGWIELN